MCLDPYFNSKEYYQKFSELENSKHSNEQSGYMSNMGSMPGMPIAMGYGAYPFYDMPRDSKKAKKK